MQPSNSLQNIHYSSSQTQLNQELFNSNIFDGPIDQKPSKHGQYPYMERSGKKTTNNKMNKQNMHNTNSMFYAHIRQEDHKRHRNNQSGIQAKIAQKAANPTHQQIVIQRKASLQSSVNKSKQLNTEGFDIVDSPLKESLKMISNQTSQTQFVHNRIRHTEVQTRIQSSTGKQFQRNQQQFTIMEQERNAGARHRSKPLPQGSSELTGKNSGTFDLRTTMEQPQYDRFEMRHHDGRDEFGSQTRVAQEQQNSGRSTNMQKKRMVYSSYLRKSTNNTDKEINMFVLNNGKNRPKLNQQVALINKHKSSIGFHHSRKTQQHVQRLGNASRNMIPKKLTDNDPKKVIKPVNQEIFTKVL